MTTIGNDQKVLDHSYQGDLLHNRYNGRGVYRCSFGQYNGEFKDGYFHGEGVLFMKGGQWKGKWYKGKLAEGKFIFEDGLEHKDYGVDQWAYCSVVDPRFHTEKTDDKLLLGMPLKRETPKLKTPIIPPGTYDTMDGYYDPNKFTIFDYDTNAEIRMPSQKEAAWIVENCRKST